jgi:glycosyltransferase involved in cell wall biosynthesis
VRILIASHHRGVVGGTESYLRTLIPALRARGHEMRLLHELPDEPDHESIDPDGASIRVATGALSEVAAWRPDLVYAHGLLDPGLEETLVHGHPSVLFAHGYYGTCASGTKRFAFPTTRPCHRTFGPMCLLCWYPRRCGGADPRTLMRSYRLQRRRNALLPSYRAVVVASRALRDEYRRHGVPEASVHVLPLFPTGVEPDAEPPAPRPARGRVALIGRLTDLKGGDVLVRALALRGQSTKLVVLGEGPERQRIESLARALGVSLELAGWVGAERRNELVRDVDAVVLPSLWPEPFGLVGIEAGCLGVPAVGFEIGGIPDWLEPGISGELAPGDPPTVEGLARALDRALGDPGHHARLRRGAWERARAYGLATHVDALERILRGVAR